MLWPLGLIFISSLTTASPWLFFYIIIVVNIDVQDHFSIPFTVTDQLPQEGVPAIFLSSSFNLEDPDTFYSVFSHVTSAGVSLKNAKILQEKVWIIYSKHIPMKTSHMKSSDSIWCKYDYKLIIHLKYFYMNV